MSHRFVVTIPWKTNKMKDNPKEIERMLEDFFRTTFDLIIKALFDGVSPFDTQRITVTHVEEPIGKPLPKN